MKILLTGGAGFIGSHTCVELCDAGHDPVIVDNYINSSAESIRRIEQIVGRPVPHYEADVADKAAMDRIFSENDFDCVIHFAGLKAVGESVAQPLRYYRNNLDTTLTLCETMQAHGVKKIVFSSSATVYGNQPVVPYREDMPSVGCTNPYGWTKYMIEKILEGQAAADPEWSVVLLRYFNPIGAHSSGLIGEDPAGIPNNLMPYIAKVAVGELEKLSVFGNDYPTPDGTCLRDYIHVLDLADAHVLAMQYLVNGGESTVFNLGSETGFSVREIIEKAKKITGVDFKVEEEARRAGDPAVLIASSAKCKKVLGWKPQHSNTEEIIKTAWNWHKEHPYGFGS